MDNNILVALIVGLTTGTSIYVWNSKSFSKVQKTILLLFLVFPPLQWLSIFAVLIYDSNKENNSIEKLADRKIEIIKTALDNSISSLTQLKEKGILTEEEYKNKVNKIEVEKNEQNLKNTIEYKQLTNLFNLGILTKEEFDNKVELLYKEVFLKINSQVEKYKKEDNLSNEQNIITYIIVGILIVIFFIYITWNS